MKPHEFWQSSPYDIFTYVAVNRPPEMVGKITRKQFERASDLLEKLEAKKGVTSGQSNRV